MSEVHRPLCALAVQYWKLCAAFDRELGQAPDGRREAAEAQLRFARRKLETILAAEGLRLGTYEGQCWSPEIPASAVNADDIAEAQAAVIGDTIEPTIIGPDGVIHAGKILLKQV